jgi:hypothetical protein
MTAAPDGMGLQAVYRRPRTTIPGPASHIRPYLLRNLEIDRPNQVWCTDMQIGRISSIGSDR